MDILRPVFALTLLAALAMGGVVLPVLHDAAHVAERAEVEQAHSGHHHHQLEDDHGSEAQPYCPDAAEIELVCALCSAPPIAVLASQTLHRSASATSVVTEATEDETGADTASRTARGPPVA